MVVEDDQNLREIYSVRLTAEGYEVVSAGDGEEALAVAVKERPDLVLSDVMMPKISGFDMLDILRSTPETKDIKVIMMTALSSEDQRKRGESLGADKYLVKSQVGIEDVVAAVHEVIGGGNGAQVTQSPDAMPAQTAAQPVQVVAPVANPGMVSDAPVPSAATEPTFQATTPEIQTQFLQGSPNTATSTQPLSPSQEPLAQAQSAQESGTPQEFDSLQMLTTSQAPSLSPSDVSQTIDQQIVTPGLGEEGGAAQPGFSPTIQTQ